MSKTPQSQATAPLKEGATTRNRARILAEKVPQEVLERLLFVPMLRIDYEHQEKTYSVRVCEINYVRYVMMYDIPLPALRRLLFHSSWSIDQLLHVHNPFSAKICTLVPYRLFDEQRERIMAKLFDDEAGQALYARFLEVAAFPQLPNRYYFDFSDAEMDESERAYGELKSER